MSNNDLTLFYDPELDFWFRASEIDFLQAAKDTSHAFTFYAAETVERFYKRMNVKAPESSDHIGWFMDENWIDNWQEYSGYIDINFSDLQSIENAPVYAPKYRIVLYFQAPSINEELPKFFKTINKNLEN